MQIGNQLVQRIPWVWPYNPRDSSFDRCPRRVNVILEKAGERIFAKKRPGLLTTLQLSAGTGQGLAFWNGGIYVVVGDTLNISSADSSGSSGATWVSAGVAPWVGRQLYQVVVCQGITYVIGGQVTGGAPLSDVWSITVGQDWKLCTAAAPWTSRGGFMAGVIGDTIYVIGGQTDAGIVGDVWASKDGVAWELKTDLMATGTVAYAAAISADNGIYLLGGTDKDFTLLDRVAFSTDGIEWRLVNDAPGWSARNLALTWYYQNKLWIGGGQDIAGPTVNNDVWYSADGGKTWTQATAAAWTAPGLSQAGVTVYANKMWAVNGYDGTSGTNKVYSSTDGATWTTVTATGPFAASYAGQVIVFATLTAISAYNYQTMYWMGGVDTTGATCNNNVYRATLDTILSNSIAIPVSIGDQAFQFASFVEGTKLLLKNESGMWVLDGGELIPITDAGFPPETVPGIVVLGGFAYVMDPSGLIRNCDIDDPYHWPMLNAVAADYEDDHGVALVKYLNYVVAFGTYTMQFFYDAGNAQGSPLRPYLAGNMAIGCYDANSIAPIGQTVAWVSRTKQGRRQVMIFNGLTPQPISTWQVEKFIAEWVGITGYSVQVPGHQFYVIWTDGTVPALAYDFATGEWTEWSNYGSVSLPLAMASSCGIEADSLNSLSLDPSSGSVYAFSNTFYDDDGNPFPVLLLTDKVDNQNNRSKFWGQFEVIGDMNTGTPSINWSDDDWQTFSAARTVDMNSQRPVLYRNGAGRRRVFQYLQWDSHPIRVEALEQTWEQGQ